MGLTGRLAAKTAPHGQNLTCRYHEKKTILLILEMIFSVALENLSSHGSVDIGTGGDENGNNFGMTVLRSKGQGGAVIINVTVDVSSRRDQALNDLKVAVLGGNNQGGNTCLGALVDVRPGIDQLGDDIRMPILGGQHNGRCTGIIMFVDVGSGLNQSFNNMGMAVLGGNNQSRYSTCGLTFTLAPAASR